MTKLSAILLLVAAAAPARADDTSTQPSAPKTQAEADEELRKMAEGQMTEQIIEIFDERPDKPFDRDTDVRLTGEQLAARGATDLASALALLPDVGVRDAGRGGFNLDVRGGRKGAVAVLIDGVSVTDPWYGTFDVSSIPITDIVQIRVSTNLQSPIDGSGGSGGVVEVLTRDAIGPQVVVGRLTSDSQPTLGMTGTGRVALAKNLALRVSASGFGSRADMPIAGKKEVDDNRHSSTGSMRLEYRKGERRIVVDGFLDSRHYLAPPSDVFDHAQFTLVDRETSARASIKADEKVDKLQLQGQFSLHSLARLTRKYATSDMTGDGNIEDLHAYRIGALALATHPIGKSMRWAASVSLDRDTGSVTNNGMFSEGKSGIFEPAGDLQYEQGKVRVDLSGGVAVPLGVDANPWPEVKAVARYRPMQELELVATGGHKGRVPSLRERFDSEVGNPLLGPEKTWGAEIRAIEKRDRFRIEVAPFVRRTTGSIRNLATPDPDDDPGAQIQSNLGLLHIYGIDTSARVTVHRMVEAGGSFNYIHARTTDSAAPLDRLPEYRADGWVQVTPDPRISILARARYFGSNIEQNMTLKAYTVLEATVTAPITKEYLGVLRVDDVTDVRPETRYQYHTVGRVISLMVQGTWE